jgi:hypothetical protein
MKLEHHWKAKSGVLGKGLKKRLPPAIWTELEFSISDDGSFL